MPGASVTITAASALPAPKAKAPACVAAKLRSAALAAGWLGATVTGVPQLSFWASRLPFTSWRLRTGLAMAAVTP